MSQTDKLLLLTALILGVLEFANVKGPLSRFSLAGLAIVLIALVELRRGGVINL
jgi:hypothetical protein